MPTPSIQTLVTDAQQVLNLDSISAVRSVVAVALANANTGTPLNPNLTTQQLWNEFYQVVTKPKSDIESIIANQLMKFLFAPPAPGGVGADKQVIFNDGGVLAGDADFLWNKTTNLLTVTGSATITGDLTVDTSTLKVDSANNRVGIGTASPSYILDILGASPRLHIRDNGTGSSLLDIENGAGTFYVGRENSTGSGGLSGVPYAGILYLQGAYPIICGTNFTERYRIASDGVATWSNVGGVAGTAMTLNSTGLGIGAAPEGRLNVANTAAPVIFSMTLVGAQRWQQIIDTTAGNWTLRDQSSSIDALIVKAGSGNLGVGVTPSAWASGNKFIDINSSAAFGAFGSSDAMMIGNAYWNGSSWIRKTANNAWRFVIESVSSTPTMTWQLAANGSAGSSITWTQAMTLTADGELLVGTASVGGVFDTKFYLSSNSGTNKWAVGPYGTATNFAIIPTPGTGGVYLSGTSATSWTAYSDERLKDIIEPITNALTKVGSLRSVIGKFKGDEANTRRPFLIAQDLQSALPEAVDASNPDRLGVAYTDVIPLLVAAIKELTAEVNALKNA